MYTPTDGLLVWTYVLLFRVSSFDFGIGYWHLSSLYPVDCSFPLGLSNCFMSGCNFTVSSTKPCSPANQSRLYNTPGAWVTAYRAGTWLEIELESVTNLTAIATQGDPDDDNWVESFALYHSLYGTYFQPYTPLDNFRNFSRSFEYLTGNSDRNTTVINNFHPTILSRFLRIYPLAVYNGSIGLRLELYACPSGQWTLPLFYTIFLCSLVIIEGKGVCTYTSVMPRHWTGGLSSVMAPASNPRVESNIIVASFKH